MNDKTTENCYAAFPIVDIHCVSKMPSPVICWVIGRKINRF